MKKELSDKFSSIQLEILDQTSIIHEFAFNPNQGTNEDKVLQSDPELKDITLVIQRFSPILDYLIQLDDLEKPLFFFKYPRLSIFWCMLIVSFILFFDPKYTLSYILALLIVLIGLQKPEIKKMVQPYLKMIFWDHPNKYLKQELAFQTTKELNVIESTLEIM